MRVATVTPAAELEPYRDWLMVEPPGMWGAPLQAAQVLSIQSAGVDQLMVTTSITAVYVNKADLVLVVRSA